MLAPLGALLLTGPAPGAHEGPPQYNRDIVGRTVPNCLVRNAYYQLAPR